MCSKYPPMIKRLEEKNKELMELVEVHQYEESKYKVKFEREQERAKRL